MGLTANPISGYRLPAEVCGAGPVKQILVLGFLIGLLSCCVGCSVMKATQQPDRKNLDVLSRGTPRTHVIAELGAPVWTENREGSTTDVYSFKQGYSRWNKAGRALFHGAADVFTLGLWEVVGTPIETIADGSAMQVQVNYDQEQQVKQVTVIKGSEQMPGK